MFSSSSTARHLALTLGLENQVTNTMGKFAVCLSCINILSGIFIVDLIKILNIQTPNPINLKWSLIIGMPILIWLTHVRLNLTQVNTTSGIIIKAIGLLAIFSIPYFWLATHTLR